MKLIMQCSSTVGKFLPNLDTLGLWIVELFAMYATDRQTDRLTDKSNAYRPLPYGAGDIIRFED